MIRNIQKIIVITVNVLEILKRFFQMATSKNKLESIMIIKKEISI